MIPASILCPIDFSDLSVAALQQAGALASLTHAKLHVGHIEHFDPPPYFTPSQIDEIRRQFRDARRQAQVALDRYVRIHLSASVAADTHIVEGNPPEGIAELAKSVSAHILVMATHGRSGVHRWLLGSVTERVLRESDIPVLTVRGPGAIAAPFSRILCAVNDTAVSRLALQWAAQLAALSGGRLIALHVEDTAATNGIADLCAWVQGARPEACEVQHLTRAGEPSAAILQVAHETSATLLVLGSGGSTLEDARLFGSTPARIVRHADIPVLTVPWVPESRKPARHENLR